MSQLPKIAQLRLGHMAGKFAEHPDPNLLAAFAGRSLSKTERAMVMDHLGKCAECRECLAVAFVPAGNVSGGEKQVAEPWKELVCSKQHAISSGSLHLSETEDSKRRESNWELDRIVYSLSLEASKAPNALLPSA
jgi:hypothetical protein